MLPKIDDRLPVASHGDRLAVLLPTPPMATRLKSEMSSTFPRVQLHVRHYNELLICKNASRSTALFQHTRVVLAAVLEDNAVVPGRAVTVPGAMKSGRSLPLRLPKRT